MAKSLSKVHVNANGDDTQGLVNFDRNRVYHFMHLHKSVPLTKIQQRKPETGIKNSGFDIDGFLIADASFFTNLSCCSSDTARPCRFFVMRITERFVMNDLGS